MKKIIKKIKSNSLFTFILGGLIFGSIGIYGANKYQSNTIEYSPTDENWEVSNVSEAINSLYSMKNELNTTKTSLNNLKGIGDATSAQILSGKKALVKGSSVTGSMTDRGAVTSSLNAGGSYTIPAGYHNGSGKITANSLASQTSATATAAQIFSGQTAWVNGNKLTGTMANRGAWTNTPTGSGNVTIPAGYHNGSGYVNTATVYTNGYNAGVTAADGRANANSVNYKTGYNAGYSAGGGKFIPYFSGRLNFAQLVTYTIPSDGVYVVTSMAISKTDGDGLGIWINDVAYGKGSSNFVIQSVTQNISDFNLYTNIFKITCKQGDVVKCYSGGLYKIS